jgi:hypothetical protein
LSLPFKLLITRSVAPQADHLAGHGKTKAAQNCRCTGHDGAIQSSVSEMKPFEGGAGAPLDHHG